MEQNYEGAARRLARVLEMSTRATHDVVASDGKRSRVPPAQQLASELSRLMAAEEKDPRRRGS